MIDSESCWTNVEITSNLCTTGFAVLFGVACEANEIRMNGIYVVVRGRTHTAMRLAKQLCDVLMQKDDTEYNNDCP